MAPSPAEVVNDDPVRGVRLSRVRGLDENHPAAMRDRLRQRRVAVVLGVDEIDVRSGVPFTQTDAGPSIPSELGTVPPG